MTSPWCIVSAPANARLMGEHAVLRGGPALVYSLQPRMKVKARSLPQKKALFLSQFGQEALPLSSITPEGPHRFMKAALRECAPFLSQGIELQVESTFDHTLGLGSSATVTAATIGALLQLTKGTCDRQECLSLSQKAIRAVQGEGSGADAAASIFGGVLLFYASDCSVQKLTDTLPLHLAYSGMKTPTKEVIAFVRQKEKENPTQTSAIFEAINALTIEATKSIEANNLPLLGKLLNKAHEQMALLGLENSPLAQLRTHFLQDPHVLGCKIAGSGLGDCLVILAQELSQESKNLCLPLFPDSRGLEVELSSHE